MTKAIQQDIMKLKRAIKMLNIRSASYLTGLVPPIPIMHHCQEPDINGVIFHAVVPADGKITTASFSFGYQRSPQMLNFIVEITHQGDVTKTNFSIMNRPTTKQIDLEVKEGDQVKISVEEEISDVMFSFMYQTGTQDAMQIHIDYDKLGVGNEGVRELIK